MHRIEFADTYVMVLLSNSQVSVPCSSLFDIVTVRCGHCTNLWSVNMAAAFQSLSWQDAQVIYIIMCIYTQGRTQTYLKSKFQLLSREVFCLMNHITEYKKNRLSDSES